MEGIELIAFQIISTVGAARSLYIEAIRLARAGKLKEAKEKAAAGEKLFIEGHKVHAQVIAAEADGKAVTVDLLLVHAEDQLMSAEAFGILAEEFIALYEKFAQLSEHEPQA